MTNSLPQGIPSGGARKKRVRLAPSQKYEVYTSLLTGVSTQADLAVKYRVDRSTIQSICRVAKQGAIDALTAAVPGRRKQVSAEQEELAAARERIVRLERTVAEQAMQLHLIEGKDSWD